MRRLMVLLTTICFFLFLTGCSNQDSSQPVKNNEISNSNMEFEKRNEFLKIEITEKKGVAAIVYDDPANLALFSEMFSKSKREPGIADMADPHFYVKATTVSGATADLQLWVGNEKMTSTWMDIDDTHTVYSVPASYTNELLTLVSSQQAKKVPGN